MVLVLLTKFNYILPPVAYLYTLPLIAYAIILALIFLIWLLVCIRPSLFNSQQPGARTSLLAFLLQNTAGNFAVVLTASV